MKIDLPRLALRILGLLLGVIRCRVQFLGERRVIRGLEGRGGDVGSSVGLRGVGLSRRVNGWMGRKRRACVVSWAF